MMCSTKHIGKYWKQKGLTSKKKTLFKIINNSLPTMNLLNKRHPTVFSSNICPRCKKDKESIKHVFFDCTASKIGNLISKLNKIEPNLGDRCLDTINKDYSGEATLVFCSGLWLKDIEIGTKNINTALCTIQTHITKEWKERCIQIDKLGMTFKKVVQTLEAETMEEDTDEPPNASNDSHESE